MIDHPSVDLPVHVLEFMASHRTLTLATASSLSVPHAATFLYVNEGPRLYFWTRPETTTARHIESNPAVAFTIEEQSSEIRQASAVQGTGECAVLLRGEEVAWVARLFGEKYPDLSPGDTLSISFFRITPEEVDFVDHRASTGRSRDGGFGADFHTERAYSVFGDLPHEDVEQFVARLQTVRAQPGDVIARAGRPADKFLIVVDGRIELQTSPMEDGQSLGPGHIFGEMAILRNTPRRAQIVATEPTTLLALDRETFRDLTARALRTTTDFDAILRQRLGLSDGV
jgi:uncharacterized protein YhbP (UPF0306 family)/quercetin dioxygenase-like cupin family protein